MKKVLCCVLITAALCMFLCSCQTEAPTVVPVSSETVQSNDETEQSDIVKNEKGDAYLSVTQEQDNKEVITFEYPEVIEYTVYSQGGTDSYAIKAQNEGKISQSVKGINNLSFGESYPSKYNGSGMNSSEDLKFDIFGKEMEFKCTNYQTCISDFRDCENPYLKSSREIKRYALRTLDGAAVTLKIDPETNEILYYSTLQDRPESGSFTMEQAKEKAIKIAKELYGEDALDSYELVYETHDEDDCRYVLWFERRIGKYSCLGSDSLRMVFNYDGELCAFQSENYGTLEGVLDKLTEENIEKAEDTLLSIFPEGSNIGERREVLIDNKTGVCYLQVSLINNNSIEEYYINIY